VDRPETPPERQQPTGWPARPTPDVPAAPDDPGQGGGHGQEVVDRPGRGSGSPGGHRLPRIRWEVQPRRRVAFVGVLFLVAFSVLLTVCVDFRVGGYVLAAALVIAAVLRATLPATYCLGLLVRSRRQDVTTDLVLAVVVAVLARTVPG
jgi:hypothetical protein